jgi:hypothetical protein
LFELPQRQQRDGQDSQPHHDDGQLHDLPQELHQLDASQVSQQCLRRDGLLKLSQREQGDWKK